MSLKKTIATLFALLSLGFISSIMAIAFVVYHYSKDLPDYSQLANYDPPTVTRLYAKDGRLLSEYAEEKRLFVPIEAIPKRLVNAFISAEDKNFYQHPGIDIVGIIRASVNNLIHYNQTKSLSGASTITQQVVKNFLLTNEQTITRKIREAILSFRITRAFPKDKILELYLNKIYLGNRTYGIAAAALYYFNKSIEELTIEEAAMLAALPKAPSSLDPWRFKDKATERRNWVITRMQEEGYISNEEAIKAMSTSLKLSSVTTLELVNAGFFTDAVKQDLIKLYGEESVMNDGYSVKTTLDPNYQQIAEQSLIKGVIAYDHKHGFRNIVKHLDLNSKDWHKEFKEIPNHYNPELWKLALVTKVNDQLANILLTDDSEGKINLSGVSWARKFRSRDSVGANIKKISEVLKSGDVILVEEQKNLENNKDSQKEENKLYNLAQIPQINGGLIAINPHTGKILAMVGGYYYGGSQFNRTTQALRQPGSSFKPFVYLTALSNGFSPNSIVVDEAIELNQGSNKLWMPKNHTGLYYGPTPLRVGLEQSRNVITVKLAMMVGLDKISDTTKIFNIQANPVKNLSIALGSAETTLLNLTTAYAMLVNGGKEIKPTLIERVQNRKGNTIYKTDSRDCSNCKMDPANLNIENISPPILIDNRKQIADPVATYQIVSMLQGVVQRGTAKQALSLHHTIGGKTGTTNDSFDAWFIGFTPDLVVGVYTGFDEPSSLGHHEYGATIALPIWIDFMEKTLKDQPDTPFRMPDGVKLVKLDVTTGLPPTASSQKENIIFESFRSNSSISNVAPKRSSFSDDISPELLEQEEGIDSRSGSGELNIDGIY